jgi:hypothetical protein
MSVAPAAPPAGYVRIERQGALVVARDANVASIAAALEGSTLHAWASRHPARRELSGRLPAWAVPLADGTPVVVRHARHGGLLAGITGDVFLAPTRAPHELAVALRLARAGVPTPDVVAYVVYAAGPLLARADVATREVEGSRDLAAWLAATDDRPREAAFAAVRELLDALARAGARHPDLNLGNVLVREDERGVLRAWVIDVDRIVFHSAGDPAVAEANLRRLLRSARKLRESRGLPVSDGELAALAATGRAA